MVALHGRGADAGMNRGIIGTHIVPEEAVKLLQGGDRVHIQRIEPGLFECSELAFDFGFGGTVTDFRV